MGKNRKILTTHEAEFVDRPLLPLTIDQLEELFTQHRYDDAVLGRISEELSYRTKDRAQQLRKEILGVLEGRIPRIRPPRAARPEDQSEMFQE